MFAQLAVMTVSLMTLMDDSQATKLEVASAALVSHDDPGMAMAQLSASAERFTSDEFAMFVMNKNLLMNAIKNNERNVQALLSELPGEAMLRSLLVKHQVTGQK